MCTAQVTANDRAPARHTDAARGRPQLSAAVSLDEYVSYWSAAPTAAAAAADAPPPFYLNGWRALSQHPVRLDAARAHACEVKTAVC
jgi:hypothetical protein